MKAIVTEIQVGGGAVCNSLEEAVSRFQCMMNDKESPRTKMHFTIRLPNGEIKTITIRDEDTDTAAYGDFEGLPSFLDYAKEELGKPIGEDS